MIGSGPDALLSVQPLATVVLAAVLVPFCSRRLAHVLGVVGLGLVAAWTLLVPDGTGPTVPFLGLELVLVSVDDAARLVGLALSAFGALAVGYTYLVGTDTRHLLLALAYAGTSLWTVFVGDWLALALGWELMAVASTLLVWYHGGEAVRAGYRYALVHAVGGGLLLVGVALHWVAVGPSATALQYDGTGISPGLSAIAVGLAVGVNAALIGVHVWLPRTYAAPHVGTSVILSAYTTKVAVYAAYRAFPEGNLVLASVGAAMTVYGVAYALAQKDMRKLLAYHIQAQVGYMLAGIGLGSALGVAGGFGHLFNNVLYKGLLFMVAGFVVVRTGQNKLDGFGALGRATPLLFATFLVAALSITGVPGFNGFVTKGMVLDAAAEADATLLEALLLAGAVGTFVSFMKFGYYAFLEGERVSIPDLSPADLAVSAPIAVACVLLGVFYPALFALLPATDAWSTDPYSRAHLYKAAVLAVGSLVAFVVAKPLFGRVAGGKDVDELRDPLVFYGTDAVTDVLARSYGWVDGHVARAAAAVVVAVRNPERTVLAALPDSLEGRYRDWARRTSGESGLKTTVALVFVAVAVVLVVGLTL
ncbi:proton-conducting transporter membrane subunit [Natronococcus sp. A-GB1]|uniref:proton-conducting transporter transmembrane domain-containing protein n=1 Tax=Natronococcus sp. A-GB1 TaxID=3037648 RepID=UPI00241D8D72|nr:proton-conducting transporter membrane subunit [Natronococcus sp. A-GB1]MDG5761724.1 proton-conducting transporter membrane subunit [Natronococcus sp. A-GB1]